MVCDVNKIDSNITGLSIAEEECLKSLPTVPLWEALEPNSYSDFGGDLTTIARQPISATRQRKKGTVTDLSAVGGFNMDVTKTNAVRPMQGFFFADAFEAPNTRSLVRTLAGTSIPLTSVATSDDSFNAASGLDQFVAGHIVLAKKFAAANNGRHVVSSAVAAKVIVTTNLTNEAAPAADASLQAVGFRFASGVISLAASATAASLALSGVAYATGTLTITGATNAVADETVTIGSVVYTWKTAPAAANQVKIGADKAASLASLAKAINLTGTAGTTGDYGVGTVQHPQVSATSDATSLVATARYSGTAANSIATTEVMTDGAWGAATLAGGAGGALGFVGLGIKVGDWVAVGGDATDTFFTYTASTNRQGYGRVAAVTDALLTFDDTTWEPQTDAGTGKTIEIFFGTNIRNQSNPSLIKTRSYQLERTLGVDSSDQTQAQYILGCIANELTLNVPTAEKITADLSFIGLDDETRTGTEGLKTGTRVAAAGEDAYNTSLDVYRIRMNVVDPAEINNDPLFGFVEAATITINNNASANKAIGNLGGFSVSVGNFDVGGSVTAYFTEVAALRAIRANADLAYNIIAAANNAGFVFDIPLMGVAGGRLNIALNQAVKIPLEPAGAQNAAGYTMSSTWFEYLPNAAMPA